jgi:hypothetical protein
MVVAQLAKTGSTTSEFLPGWLKNAPAHIKLTKLKSKTNSGKFSSFNKTWLNVR